MNSPDIALPNDRKPSQGWVLWPAQRLARAVLVLPIFCAAFTIAVWSWDGEHFSSDAFRGLGGLDGVILGWNLLPPVALAGLILLCARRFPIGLRVTAVGCVVYTAGTVGLLLRTVFSESSTAGFLFISLPLILLGVVGVFAAGAGLVDATRRPRAPILK